MPDEEEMPDEEDDPGLLPFGFASFLLGKRVEHYEDAYVVCDRDESGKVTMTGKPLRPVFIYGDE